MKTINQINAFCANNATIGLYHQCSADYNKFVDNWRNRYFTFYPDRPTELTNAGNFLYGAANTELKRFCGLEQYDGTKYEYLTVADDLGYTYKIRVMQQIGLSGVYLKIEANGAKFLPNEYFIVSVKSNETFESLNPVQYFESRILPKYLFGAGLLRRLQLVYNLNKADAKKRYKELKTAVKEPFECDTQKALRHRVIEKLNLVPPQFIAERTASRLLATETRRKTRTGCAPYPNCLDVLDGFDGDIEEVPALVDDYLHENYKPKTYFY